MLQKTSPEIGGMGHSVKRKEDLRFIQGKGTYVDDVNLPGMVYGHMVRSPYAHARITGIRSEEAKKLPGVLAVITGQDLEKAGLAWMPTLFHDKQMVLATGKVLFQSQEVAFVVAEDRYTAADAAELIEVDYEDLPVLVDPHRALGCRRPDPPGRSRRKDQSHFSLGSRGQAGHRRSLSNRSGQGRTERFLSAVPSGAAGNLRMRRRLQSCNDQINGLGDFAGAPRAPDTLCFGRGPGRTEHSHYCARHRRRIREQGSDLSWLRLRRSGVASTGPACKVD